MEVDGGGTVMGGGEDHDNAEGNGHGHRHGHGQGGHDDVMLTGGG